MLISVITSISNIRLKQEKLVITNQEYEMKIFENICGKYNWYDR